MVSSENQPLARHQLKARQNRPKFGVAVKFVYMYTSGFKMFRALSAISRALVFVFQGMGGDCSASTSVSSGTAFSSSTADADAHVSAKSGVGPGPGSGSGSGPAGIQFEMMSSKACLLSAGAWFPWAWACREGGFWMVGGCHFHWVRSTELAISHNGAPADCCPKLNSPIFLLPILRLLSSGPGVEEACRMETLAAALETAQYRSNATFKAWSEIQMLSHGVRT